MEGNSSAFCVHVNRGLVVIVIYVIMEKEIFFVNKPEEITRVIKSFESIGGMLHVPASMIMRISLALEEAIANIIKNAYPPGEQHEITLRIKAEGEELTFSLIDDGISFDPTLIEVTDVTSPLEQRILDGLGIFLIRKIMDEISYECTEKENRLVMKKKVSMKVEEEKTMEINICKIEGMTIVAIGGRLDTANTRDFDVALQPLLNDMKSNIIVNCENLTYICSAGLRSFILLQKNVTRNNGQLVLEAMTPDIRKIFEMTGCTSIFTIR